MSDDPVQEVRHANIVGAIRLALAGATDDASAVAVVRWLVDFAPPTPDDWTGPVELLMLAIRETKGARLEVRGGCR